MVGGYLSFAGIDGKARYHATPVNGATGPAVGQPRPLAGRPVTHRAVQTS